MEIIHSPVLLAETLEYLSPRKCDEVMIDCTLGEGGHTEAFLKQFTDLKIIGLDADINIQKKARERLTQFGERMTFKNCFFDDFLEECVHNGTKVDTILFDLGISVYHYESSNRGFSFRKDEALDMRIFSEGETASDIVNSYREDDLANLIFEYGEERYSRRIAHGIVDARGKSKIVNSAALAEIIYKSVPSDYRKLMLHPATKTFQALRIAVNKELERLNRALVSAVKILKPDGRLGVITFHSLEDRIVKQFFRELNKVCTCPPEWPICKCGGKRTLELITRKPVGPTEEETKRNAPSRSAKLRVAKKI